MQDLARAMIGRQRACLSSLLALRRGVRAALKAKRSPDFKRLKELMNEVERRERQDQQVEERHLLTPLEARQPSLAPVLKRLRRDHSSLKGYGIRLRSHLGYWEQGDPNAASQAATVANDYAHFCLLHLRNEHRHVIPAAEKALTEQERQQAAQAFA